ncbi:replication initiator protein [Dipodfec virus UOA04_Rod_991]|nr:replication initiator protein [Dipodfec virus UOA04_Rod_991]
MRCLHPIRIRTSESQFFRETMQYRLGILKYPPYEYQLVPCGKCELCLSKKRQEWFFRLHNELMNSDSAYFITLTYNDENLPLDGRVNKNDTDDFLKRFRKFISPYQVRYFLVSEYGEDFGRPHYHMLLFNFPDCFNIREVLKKTWKKCDDFIWDIADSVGTVSSASINYVCKYCLSTLDSDDPAEKTFMSCSRRPGIGLGYLTPAMVRYLKEHCDGRAYCDGRFYALPRYLREKVFDSYEKAKLKNQYFYEYQQDLEECLNNPHDGIKCGSRVVQQQRDQETAMKIRKKLKNGKKS